MKSGMRMTNLQIDHTSHGSVFCNPRIVPAYLYPKCFSSCLDG